MDPQAAVAQAPKKMRSEMCANAPALVPGRAGLRRTRKEEELAAQARVVTPPLSDVRSRPAMGEAPSPPEPEVDAAAPGEAPNEAPLPRQTYGQLALGKLAAVQEQTKTCGGHAVEKLAAVKAQTVELVKTPKFQTVTISTAGGAIILGSVGGAFGAACGVVIGTAAGAVPALFTFGLSLPAGAVAGGGLGLFVGTAAGAGTGALGGAAGSCVYTSRAEVRDGFIYVRTKAHESVDSALETLKSNAGRLRKAVTDANDATQKMCLDKVTTAKTRAADAASAVQAQTARAKATVVTTATDLGESAKLVATNPNTWKGAASAAGGATVVGAAGGACGAAAGGTLGAAVGLVPAVFTFGLSIPVCAVMGGGAGLFAGSALGSGVGAIGGAAGYRYRAEIKAYGEHTVEKLADAKTQTVGLVKDRASDLHSSAISMGTATKDRACDAVWYLRSSASSMGTKAKDGASQVTVSVRSLIGGATGGTGSD